MYTLVNCHSNRKSTRIEDVFRISYWTRWNFIAMLSYQRVIALCFPAPEVLGLSTRWWPWFLSLIRLLPWHGPGSVSGKKTFISCHLWFFRGQIMSNHRSYFSLSNRRHNDVRCFVNSLMLWNYSWLILFILRCCSNFAMDISVSKPRASISLFQDIHLL